MFYQQRLDENNLSTRSFYKQLTFSSNPKLLKKFRFFATQKVYILYHQYIFHQGACASILPKERKN